MLLHNADAKYHKDIASKFIQLVSTLKFNQFAENNYTNYYAIFDAVKKEMLTLGYDTDTIVDTLVLHLFANKRNSKKKAFWVIYGDEVYSHLKYNLDENTAWCERCHKRFYKTRKDQKYCSSNCSKFVKAVTKEKCCIDCGKPFVVSSKANRRIRCDDCTAKHRKETLHNNYMKRKFIASI